MIGFIVFYIDILYSQSNEHQRDERSDYSDVTNASAETCSDAISG